MNAKAIQKRNEKSEFLKVLQTEDGQYFVESGEGKILYKVIIDDSGAICTCVDFARNRKKDPEFACKHIISVWNAIPSKEVEGATFLKKSMPKLDERFLTKINELQEALDNIKTLKGLLPICAGCKKIRDDKGCWNYLETYIERHSDASFSHGLCPHCSDELYGKEDWYIEMKKKRSNNKNNHLTPVEQVV
jgi:hypothetical protein